MPPLHKQNRQSGSRAETEINTNGGRVEREREREVQTLTQHPQE